MALALSHIEYGADGGDARPPLVILHGLFGSAKNWNLIARRLADKRRIHALDLRNHGGAPWADTLSYPEMAADVARFLDDHGLDRADVIGHSMGGKVAMVLALTHPRRVARLVVADIAPVTYTHSFENYVDAMRRIDLAGVTRRGEVDAQLAPDVPEPGLRSFLLQNLVLEDGTFRWRINLEAIGAGMADLTGFPDDLQGRRFDGPSLFLTGGRSDYVRPEHAAAIRRLFPNAAIETIPDAGHWLHAEKPEAFIERVSAFLES